MQPRVWFLAIVLALGASYCWGKATDSLEVALAVMAVLIFQLVLTVQLFRVIRHLIFEVLDTFYQSNLERRQFQQQVRQHLGLPEPTKGEHR